MTRLRILALLLVVATVLTYSNSFSIPFLFDDQNSVVENPTIRSLSPLSRVLNGPAQSSTAGRPLVNLSFALNYAIGGFSPAGYHFVNLLAHTLCGLLLFGLVRRTLSSERPPSAIASAPTGAASGRFAGKGKRSRASAGTDADATATGDRDLVSLTAFFCALIWLLHPLQTEAIDYVTQRSESMMALFYLSTCYAFVRSLQAPAPFAWQAISVIACACGMLCKESMVTAPLVLLLFDVVFFSSNPVTSLRTRPMLYAGLAATWIVLAVMNVSGPRSHSAGFSSGVSPGVYLLNQGPIIARYFRLVVAPIGLVFDYGIPKQIGLREALPASLFVAAIGIGAALAWRFHRGVGFLLSFVFITLAPTSSVVPIATEVGAERRMYLPLAAVVVLAVVGAQRRLTRRQLLTAGTAVSLVLAALTFKRNIDYQDPLHLWQTVLERYPHGRAHYGLGLALKNAGRRDEGLREMEVAARDFADAEYAIGFELVQQGRYADALSYLRRYVEAKPDDANVLRAYNLLGQSLMGLGRADESAAAFRETLLRQPGNLDARGGLGDALVRLERYDEAIAVYAEFLRVTTTNPSAYFNYGLALAARDRDAEAISAFRSASRLNPNDPATHANLAEALVRTGNTAGAIAEFERVLALERDPATRQEIAAAIAALRK